MARPRVSAISYLNTAPLMWGLEHGRAKDQFEITYTVPSRCAAEMADGLADIGIIPSAAYASIPGLSILPGIAIAAKRAVRSILLVSPKPMAQIHSVALDSSSITSAALARILFQKCWGGGRRFESRAPDLGAMLETHDAAMLIGDTALRVDRSRYYSWDLAEEWIRFTGKPFVFAFWAVREPLLAGSNLDLGAIFQESRDHGLMPAHLSEISRSWAARLKISEEDIRQYLTTNIHYFLDGECLEGLRLFYRYGFEGKALSHAPEVRFLAANGALI
ncbi:MAG: menaquinone biosynthesis protein [Acidobacteria bacterium]|nr:menaquinone biosynthesis protein [Acidobacteriota bacterium]